MAEEHNNPAVDPQEQSRPDGQANNPSGETEKMVSVAEMQRRLKQAEEKHAQATQEAIAQALEKYKTESELTGKELKEVEQNYFLLYSIMTKPLPVTPTVIHHSFRASTIENDKLDRSKESSFVRALINLQNARRSGQLSVKIDFYMQVLQCIYALEGMKSTKIEKTLQEVTKNLLDLTVTEQTVLANALMLSSNSTEDEFKNENKGIFNTIKKQTPNDVCFQSEQPL